MTDSTNCFPRYMMATTAIHKLGDISSDIPDICVVSSETETDYIGNWVFGLGFFDVKFPKSTTKELTEEDKLKYNGLKLHMYGCHTGKYSHDCGTINV
jgi:hypothetical protein